MMMLMTMVMMMMMMTWQIISAPLWQIISISDPAPPASVLLMMPTLLQPALNRCLPPHPASASVFVFVLLYVFLPTIGPSRVLMILLMLLTHRHIINNNLKQPFPFKTDGCLRLPSHWGSTGYICMSSQSHNVTTWLRMSRIFFLCIFRSAFLHLVTFAWIDACWCYIRIKRRPIRPWVDNRVF